MKKLTKDTLLDPRGSIILCLDIATKTGIAHNYYSKDVMVSTHTGTPLELADELDSMLVDSPHPQVFIESLHTTRNMKTTTSLLERIGYIKYYLIKIYEANVTMVNPRVARSFLGAAGKKDVGIYFQRQTDDPDEADALALYAWATQQKRFAVVRRSR